ncbi:MAG TPA: class I SAM-dependent methyltransferase [Sedimentisphaerales bacterium]|nr:class I SAM-dependent methyltransferase [Sedimentisphaerales bacterium]
MAGRRELPQLKLLPYREYAGVDRDDPLRFYYWPIIGRLYRRRVELCLGECTGGRRVLEVGFGSGVTFPNLNEKYQEIHGLDLKASVEEVAAVFERRQIRAHLQNGSVLAMPYENDFFDTVLLISILEHLKPSEQSAAFGEIGRVLKPGGQVVYGAPIERGIMVLMFRLLGFNIREHHFSTERDVCAAAERYFDKVRVVRMRSPARGPWGLLVAVYEVGHFVKVGPGAQAAIRRELEDL